MWVDQVRFEVKCTPRFLTVCSRDNASPLMRESGSWGEVFWDKRGIPHTYSCWWEVRGQHSRLKGDEGLHPSRNHPHTLAVYSDGMWGSHCARRIEREKERLPAEHPRCCTDMKNTDHLGILVVTCWWNRTATIELSKMGLQGSRVYQEFVSVGWY